MKSIQLFGEGLHENLFVTPPIRKNEQNLSSIFFVMGIPIKFIEEEQIKQGRLLFYERERGQNGTKDITTFSGIVSVEKAIHQVIGWHISDASGEYLMEETHMTFLGTVSELLKINISKTEFMRHAKKICDNTSQQCDDEGNLKNGFSRSRTGGNNTYLENKNITVYTEMYKDLFPVKRKTGKKEEMLFGEFVEENLIRTISMEEALIRGVSFR